MPTKGGQWRRQCLIFLALPYCLACHAPDVYTEFTQTNKKHHSWDIPITQDSLDKKKKSSKNHITVSTKYTITEIT